MMEAVKESFSLAVVSRVLQSIDLPKAVQYVVLRTSTSKSKVIII